MKTITSANAVKVVNFEIKYHGKPASQFQKGFLAGLKHARKLIRKLPANEN